MDINEIPVLWLLLITFLLVVLAIETEYRIGAAIRKRREVETESTVSSISGYVLALLAFIIAFTFSIVTDRYQDRKELVREEANILRSTWMRAEFLPDSDRVEAKKLIRQYTSLRLEAVNSLDPIKVKAAMLECNTIQLQLWEMAVGNVKQKMDSDVAALYIESLNDVANVNASRVIVGLHTRIPEGIWEVLFLLTLLAMFSVGYQAAIVGSRRSWATIIMALSFSLVIVMIETLDRSHTRLIPVSQFPMEYLLDSMQEIK